MYVDAFHDRDRDLVRVVERVDGVRVLKDYPAPHVFYAEHPGGSHPTIFGDLCKRYESTNARKFRAKLEEVSAKHRIFESDINPVFRLLADKYMGAESPVLNIGYFDIEADFDPERGYAPTEDPFNAVTAISLYRTQDKRLLTFGLRPAEYTREQCDEIEKRFEDTFIFDTEKELLDCFLAAIEDIDVLTGWNSEGYDVPYLVNRVKRTLGSEAIKRFCLWGLPPREREYVKFQKRFKTYEFVGRVHLDSLILYQKHNTQQQHSYSLDAIGEAEGLGRKVPYEGTLYDLYHKDFEKFIDYSRQDVNLLMRIDQKRKFIDLSNQVAHGNCVLLKTTVGSVSLVEQAIINEMHKMGRIVPDRRKDGDEDDAPAVGEDDEDEEKKKAVGAYVAKPKTGLRDEVGCCDINSLYPSAIRALNMSPETIFGQVRQNHTEAEIARREAAGIKGADLWEGLFSTVEVAAMHARDPNLILTLDLEGGDAVEMTAAELYEFVFDPASNVCITANGTLFRTDVDGMIPALLATWYSERKALQKKQKEWAAKAKEAKEAGDKTAQEEAEYWTTFYDQRQLAKKILLNSLYGALLNEGLRFYDARLGQSTTLSGRSIVKHMNAQINEVITGVYDHTGDAIVYADTDSCYFSVVEFFKAKGILPTLTAEEQRATLARFGIPTAEFAMSMATREGVIELYDAIAEEVNETFPEFMARTFNTSLERGAIIKAGRELVGSRGLFIKKKKYAILNYDKEGERLDVGGKPGKIKAMGLDLKRADTPKFMQKFLEKLLMGILTGEEQSTMYEWIKQFRRDFKSRPAWEKGTPKKVNGLTQYGAMLNKASTVVISAKAITGGGKVNMPGHVRAAINWNTLCDKHDDKFAMRISDGAKVIVCKLRANNLLRMDSVAYPIDELHLPDWFKALPFDDAAMEETIIDMKIENLVEVLGWDLSKTKESSVDGFFSFT